MRGEVSWSGSDTLDAIHDILRRRPQSEAPGEIAEGYHAQAVR